MMMMMMMRVRVKLRQSSQWSLNHQFLKLSRTQSKTPEHDLKAGYKILHLVY